MGGERGELPIPRGVKLFQINEDDLATLERELPRILDAQYASLDNSLRLRWRQVQRILTDIRWNYGPPDHVETIPAGDAP